MHLDNPLPRYELKITIHSITGEPKIADALAGTECARQNECDVIIALGGGSAIDAGKAIAALCTNPGEPLDYLEVIGKGQPLTQPPAPFIAIPTTAGTGSEVGRAGVLTNTATQEKKIIFHPKILPTVVICDPELTVGMPQKITAGTGMDAFAHCLEAYCSPFYHPLSQGVALEGMRLVKEYLPRAYADGTDLEARAHMMSPAAMRATAFTKGLGAIHALSHPLGAMYHTHHGTTNAVCMAAVLQFNRPVIEGLIERAAAYLNIEGGFEGFAAFVDQLNASLGIPRNLDELGVNNPDLEALTRTALTDPCVGGNPVAMTPENTRQLYEALL